MKGKGSVCFCLNLVFLFSFLLSHCTCALFCCLGSTETPLCCCFCCLRSLSFSFSLFLSVGRMLSNLDRAPYRRLVGLYRRRHAAITHPSITYHYSTARHIKSSLQSVFYLPFFCTRTNMQKLHIAFQCCCVTTFWVTSQVWMTTPYLGDFRHFEPFVFVFYFVPYLCNVLS